MRSSLLAVQAPALRVAIAKLFGESAVPVIVGDYEHVAALGGNSEVGLVREEGVSYNQRMARISLLALEEGGVRNLSELRALLWSTLPDIAGLGGLSDDEIRLKAAAVLSGDNSSDTAVNTIRAAIALDTIRHFHMTMLDKMEKLAYMRSAIIVALLREDCPIAEKLKVKLEHAIKMQLRLLESVDDGVRDG
jgi:hypothetical protein